MVNLVSNPKDRFSYDMAHFICSTVLGKLWFLMGSFPPRHVPCLSDTFEPHYEKIGFLHIRKTKTQISCAVAAKLISTFAFATWIVQSLFFLNPKFQASSHLLWLYSPVCVRPGRKPRRLVFSQRGSFDNCFFQAVLSPQKRFPAKYC